MAAAALYAAHEPKIEQKHEHQTQRHNKQQYQGNGRNGNNQHFSNNNRNQHYNGRNENSENQNSNNMKPNQQSNNEQVYNPERNRERKKPYCHKCKEEGHYTNQCTKDSAVFLSESVESKINASPDSKKTKLKMI